MEYRGDGEGSGMEEPEKADTALWTAGGTADEAMMHGQEDPETSDTGHGTAGGMMLEKRTQSGMNQRRERGRR